MVRFHQLDSEWGTPNIYSYTKGPRLTTTRELSEVSLEHLDYLIYCLKNAGIYVYFDMLTYRKFKSGDGIQYAEWLRDAGKPYSMYDERMIELQKEFAEKIWTHYNPYTKLQYKDDPVFVMMELINEGDLFSPTIKPMDEGNVYYRDEFRAKFEAWVKEQNIDYDFENYDMRSNQHGDMVMSDFKMYLTKKYYSEMVAKLREIGVKIPITGTNWTKMTYENTLAQSEMDFTDSHAYFYGTWDWQEENKICANYKINGNRSHTAKLTPICVNQKPFFVSEWDMPWPNAYRAEGPIYLAALTALQGWGGMTIHTYAYGTRLSEHTLLGKEVSSSTIAGVAYREGLFSTWNDPAKFGLFYHCALIVRRGDISPAAKKYGLKLKRGEWDLKAIEDAPEVHRIRVVYDGDEAVGCEGEIQGADTFPLEDTNLLVSDRGETWRDIAKQLGGIDSPRTKALYGNLKAAHKVDAEGHSIPWCHGFDVKSKTDFGVIALSSLTDEPIETSDNMLLSTIGRAHNDGVQFDGDKLISHGQAPILSEVIRATLSIKTNRTDLKVWGVNAEGYYVGQIPATFENGTMTFTLGEQLPAIYYLIVAE